MSENDNKNDGPFGQKSQVRNSVVSKPLGQNSKMPSTEQDKPEGESTTVKSSESKKSDEGSSKKKTTRKKKKKTQKKPNETLIARNLLLSESQLEIIDEIRGLVPFSVFLRNYLEKETKLFK